MLKLLSSLFTFLFILPIGFASGDVVLEDDEYVAIVARLIKDKSIIEQNVAKWEALRKATPTVKYTVVEGGLIIQSVLVPILNDTPLEYKNSFEVTDYEIKKKFFPFTFQLIGAFETKHQVDAKLGIKFLSLAPLSMSFIQQIGFNLLIGIKSANCSISYNMPKPFPNTAIHVFYGWSYNAELAPVFGLGVSLNF